MNKITTSGVSDVNDMSKLARSEPDNANDRMNQEDTNVCFRDRDQATKLADPFELDIFGFLDDSADHNKITASGASDVDYDMSKQAGLMTELVAC